MTNKRNPKQIIDERQALRGLPPHEEQEEVRQNPPIQDNEAVTRVKRSRLVQLSLVPELVPAANAAIRSCLFTTGVGPREMFNDYTPIITWHKNLIIRYKGEELRQDDCSLWIQLCKKATLNPHFRVSCSFYQLLKELKLTDTGPNRKKLREQLDRLFEGKLHITFGNIEYKGSILPEFAIDGDGKIVANLSLTISKLLGIHDFSMLNWDVRLTLPPTSQWFHGFLKSQSGPDVIISWDQIKGLSGSKEHSMDNFKRNFRKAVIKPLQRVGFILFARTQKGKLHVVIDKSKG
ncbi:MAG: hypothetical protein AB7U63_09580 [Porticoccaceae bacterium]